MSGQTTNSYSYFLLNLLFSISELSVYFFFSLCLVLSNIMLKGERERTRRTKVAISKNKTNALISDQLSVQHAKLRLIFTLRDL